MSAVRRFPLRPQFREIRELRTVRSNGLIVMSVHNMDRPVSGPFAVREADLPTLRAALAEAADEIAADCSKEPAR